MICDEWLGGENIVTSYQELIVWKKAVNLVVLTYRLVKLLPKEETFALSNQMRRAAVSIPSNIAEGQSRNSTREFAKFLSIVKGSNAELQTQCIICVHLSFITPEQAQPLLDLSGEVGRMLNSLLAKLTTNH